MPGLPGVQVSENVPGAAFGAQKFSQISQGLGSIQQAGSAGMQFFAYLQRQDDYLKVTQKIAEQRDWQNSFMQEAMQKRGIEASGLTKAFIEAQKEKAKELEKTLETPRQIAMFRMAQLRYNTYALNAIQRHEIQQKEAAFQEETKKQMELDLHDVAQDPYNDDLFQARLKDFQEKTVVLNRGLTPKALEEVKRKAAEVIVEHRVQAIIADAANYEGREREEKLAAAKEVLAQHRKVMDGVKYSSLLSTLKQAEVQAKGDRIGEEAFDKYGEEAIYKITELNNLSDEVKTRALERVKDLVAKEKMAQVVKEKEAVDRILTTFDEQRQTMTKADLTKMLETEYDNLSPSKRLALRNQLESYIDARDNNRLREEKAQIRNQILETYLKDPKAFLDLDIQDVGAALDPTERAKFIEMQNEMRRGETTLKTKFFQTGMKTADSVFKSYFPKPTKLKDESEEDYQARVDDWMLKKSDFTSMAMQIIMRADPKKTSISEINKEIGNLVETFTSTETGSTLYKFQIPKEYSGGGLGELEPSERTVELWRKRYGFSDEARFDAGTGLFEEENKEAIRKVLFSFGKPATFQGHAIDKIWMTADEKLYKIRTTDGKIHILQEK